jgi:NADPH:quinone reductase-like Zn-dependent oxidoreductase
MRAIVYETYGAADVLHLRDVEMPAVGATDVLVRVRASSINPYDWHFMTGLPYFMRLFSGLRRPRKTRLGLDFAGEVVEAGEDVTRFQPGDAVYGMSDGAFAEYLSMPESEAAHKPANLTFEQAAAVPLAAVTALQGLRDTAEIQPGQRALIIGAGGGVGSFAVPLAKRMGAHVTGVCSASKLEFVSSLGADAVIDYTREDFTTSGETYDAIFELAGTASPRRLRRALTPTGKLVMSSGDSEGRWLGPMDRIALGSLLSPFVSQTIVSLNTKRSASDLKYLAGLIEEGGLQTVISATYELSETADAMRTFERGHVRGKIALTLS